MKIGKAKSDEKRQGEGVLKSEKWAYAVDGMNLGIFLMNASLTPLLISAQLDLNDLVVWYKLGTMYYFPIILKIFFW
jgi:hypothetical protein